MPCYNAAAPVMILAKIHNMCGIFSYVGPNLNSTPITIEGLKKLEYRGYDSWGIAYKDNDTNEVKIHKKVGKISEVPSNLLDSSTHSHIAMGHSRWATHGGVSEANAHPHASLSGDFIIVHNGIFENYSEIKKELESKGYKFKSTTDTEVAAYLIEDIYKSEKDVIKSIQKALQKLEGRYAILVINKYDNSLIAARRGSPLIVGSGQNSEGKNEYYVASDVPAFLKHTNKVMYLDDEQMLRITYNGAESEIEFFDIDNLQQIEKRTIEVNIEETEAEKGDFAHFMIKEIMDQKETLARSINQSEEQILKISQLINDAFGTYLIGCGTAGKVALTGTYLFSKIAQKHVNFAFGSEFEVCRNFIKEGSLVIAISQSGETADTLEALEIAKSKGATIVSIVNVEGSSIARMSDYCIPLKVGPEKAVASTKATTSQLAILILLAYATSGKLDEGKQLLINTSGKINDMLNPRYEEHILELAQKIVEVESMYIIGKGENYPMALEAAIKLQEVSYIHAEGFAGGELKHGPLALISKDTPVIVLAPHDENYKSILSNAQEIKARGGYIIGVSPDNHEIFDFWIRVPEADIDSPVINIIPIQILSYHLAVLRKNDPDKPRNLAKSVTVK